jgi:hypothetical protein
MHIFQAHFSKLSLYNYGDIIGGCDIMMCTGTPGRLRGTAYDWDYILDTYTWCVLYVVLWVYEVVICMDSVLSAGIVGWGMIGKKGRG